MNPDLLELPTRRLLEKIGAGNHKPGSGSAAALNGLLSSKLLLTVIELTLNKPKYSHCHEEFTKLKDIIETRIGLRLEVLFQEDSAQFDKAIQKRNARDKESNQRSKNDLQEESLRELKKSTEIPIEIADLCIQLAKYSVIIFDKGFKSARGDSAVALSSALSGLAGCISIISLNLQSFPKSVWTDSIHIQNKRFRKELARLNIENVRQMDTLDAEAERKSAFLAEFIEIRRSLYGKSKITHEEIENLARRIQNALWTYRKLIWIDKPPKNRLGVLKAEKVIELLKYAFHKVETLGVNEHNEEIAGVINNEECTITISGMYRPDVINFTTAHELGHALMHNRLELHRDIPLDGSDPISPRALEEVQADKFAAMFLMPKKVVSELFIEQFQMEKFAINDETAFSLAQGSVSNLRKKVKTKRDLSRMIASCEYYNFKSFSSLASIFHVSTEAMAIRLEELGLIEF